MLTVGQNVCQPGLGCVSAELGPGNCSGTCEPNSPTPWMPGVCTTSACPAGQLCEPSFIDGGGYTCVLDPLAGLPGDGGACLYVLPTPYSPSYLCAPGLYCDLGDGGCGGLGGCGTCAPQIADATGCQQSLPGPICTGADVCAGAVLNFDPNLGWQPASAGGTCRLPSDVGGSCTPTSSNSDLLTVTGCAGGLDCVGAAGTATCQIPPSTGPCEVSANNSTDSSCEARSHSRGADNDCHPAGGDGSLCTPYTLNECQAGDDCAVLTDGGGVCTSSLDLACFFLP